MSFIGKFFGRFSRLGASRNGAWLCGACSGSNPWSSGPCSPSDRVRSSIPSRGPVSAMAFRPAAAAQHQTLADLPAAAQHAISSAIGQDQSAYQAVSAATGATLVNAANAFTARVQSGALLVSAGSDIWDMSLEGVSYGGAVQSVGTVQTAVNGNRVDCNYGTIDEWYVNGPSGLEQGFNVAPPTAVRRQRFADGGLGLGRQPNGDSKRDRGRTVALPVGRLRRAGATRGWWPTTPRAGRCRPRWKCRPWEAIRNC